MSSATLQPSSSGSDGGLLSGFVYHETQVASLCGQHCLNNLLQGPYFTSASLSDIAIDLDNQERMLRSQDTAAFESVNVDDSGNFSLSVLSEAIRRSHNVELQRVRFGSRALANLSNANGFVCNLESHWFPIRPISNGKKTCWFNLDSLKNEPTLVSDFYLSAYIAQLQENGHSVFQVMNALPPLLKDTSMGLASSWHSFDAVAVHKKLPPSPQVSTASLDSDMLQAAIAASLGGDAVTASFNEEEALARAIAASIQ